MTMNIVFCLAMIGGVIAVFLVGFDCGRECEKRKNKNGLL